MIIENNLGAFEIETRLPEVPASAQAPNPVPFSPHPPVPFGYLAPGCLGRFHRSGLEKPIVDDAKYKVGDPFKQTKHLVGTVRGGIFGGLGAFAVDWHREGNGVVEFDQRRISNGPPYSSFWHEWMDNRLIQGAYRVEQWSRPIYDPKEIVAFAVRTYFRDSVGHCFTVTHNHHFRRDVYAVEISVKFDYEGSDRCWIKEPRLVTVLDMMGHPIYVLSNDRAHRYNLQGLIDPAKTTLTIGPTANSPQNRYKRYGIRFHGLDLTFQGQSWENTNFGGGMRHAYLKRGNPKAIPNKKVFGDPLGDFNEHGHDPSVIVIDTEGGKTGPHQKRLVLKDNWEITKHESLSTCSVPMHSWPASITKYDYAGGFRRVRKNEEFHVTLRLAKEHFHG